MRYEKTGTNTRRKLKRAAPDLARLLLRDAREAFKEGDRPKGYGFFFRAFNVSGCCPRAQRPTEAEFLAVLPEPDHTRAMEYLISLREKNRILNADESTIATEADDDDDYLHGEDDYTPAELDLRFPFTDPGEQGEEVSGR